MSNLFKMFFEIKSLLQKHVKNINQTSVSILHDKFH